MAVITLYELANSSIGSPEPGAVNFKALHSLLIAIIKHLKIGEVPTDVTEEQIRYRSAGEEAKGPTEGIEEKGGGEVAEVKPAHKVEENGNKPLMQSDQTLENRIIELEKQMEALKAQQPESEPLKTSQIEVTSPMDDASNPDKSQPGSDQSEKTKTEEQQLVTCPALEMKTMIEANDCGVSKALALYEDLQKDVSGLKESSVALETKLKTMMEGVPLGDSANAQQHLNWVEQQRNEQEEHDKSLKEMEFIQHRLSELEEKLTLFLGDAPSPAKPADTVGVKEQDPKESAPYNPQESQAGSTASKVFEKPEEALQKQGDLSHLTFTEVAKAVPDMQNKLHMMEKDIQELKSLNEKRNLQHQIVEPVTKSESGDKNTERLRQVSFQTESLKANLQDMERELKDMREKQEHVKTDLEQLVVSQFLQLNEQKADKGDVEDKVTRAQFQALEKQLETMNQDLLSRISEHEKECQSIAEKLNLEIQNKCALMESDSFMENIDERLTALSKQVGKLSMEFGTEAAVVRTNVQTKLNCLSCGRPVKMNVPGPKLIALPDFPEWPVHRSNSPCKLNDMKAANQHSDRSVPVSTRNCGGAHTKAPPSYYMKKNFLIPHPPGKKEPTTATSNQEDVNIHGREGKTFRERKDLQLPPIDLKFVLPQISGKETPTTAFS